MHAFRHPAVGELHYDDGAVDEHPDGQDQAEQNHNVHGQTECGNDQDSCQERSRNCQAHKAGAADSKCGNDHDHHEDDGGHDVVLQVGEHVSDLHGLILDEGDFHGFRPFVGFQLRDAPDILDGIDDVFAESLLDFERDRRPAVKPGVGPWHL